jgi:hypothetical protein
LRQKRDERDQRACDESEPRWKRRDDVEKEQDDGEHEGRRKKTPEHEVAADAEYVRDVQRDAERNRQEPKASRDDRRADGRRDQERRQRIVRGGFHEIPEPLHQEIAGADVGVELRIRRVREGKAVIENGEELPREERHEADGHVSELTCDARASGACGTDQTRDQERCDEQQVIEPVYRKERCEQRDDERAAPAALADVDDDEQEVRERVFEAARRKVDEGRRKAEREHREGARERLDATRQGDDRDGGDRAHETEQHADGVHVLGRPVDECDEQRPERVRERLHAFGRVREQAVAADEVCSRAKGREGIVGEPPRLDDDDRIKTESEKR